MTRMEQPASQGTPEDVERIVRRDFAPNEVDAAFDLLRAYNPSIKERPARVPLAALKCANGNLENLERVLEEARCDYRDVLLWAEYPINAKVGMRKGTTQEQYDESIRQDWKNYCDWLNR